MKKIILIILVIVVIGLVYALNEDSENLRNDLSKMGVGVIGNFNYKDGILTISSGSSATLTKDLGDNVKEIKINGGTVKLPNNAVFTGDGSYKQAGGFAIKNGNLNGIDISNANGVAYNGNQISGTTSSVCSPSCMVGGEKIGQNTKFVYNLGQNLLTATGKIGTTTFPNANIVFDGVNYKLGNMIVNLKDSEIYLAQGDRMTFDGTALTADKRPVRLSFIQDAGGYKLTPVRNFVVLGADSSISDVFKNAGYLGSGIDSENFVKRKEIYESTYPGETYSGTATQNNNLLNALKNGEALLPYNRGSNVQIVQPTKPESAVGLQSSAKIQGTIATSANNFIEQNFNGIQKNLGQYITDSQGSIRPILDVITETANRYGVDTKTAESIIAIESSGSHFYSSGNVKCYGISCGLGQMTTIAVQELNRMAGYEKYTWDVVKNNPYTNVQASIEYYSLLLKQFGGNEANALAAYNAGPTITQRYLQNPNYQDVPKWTKPYIARFLAYKSKI